MHLYMAWKKAVLTAAGILAPGETGAFFALFHITANSIPRFSSRCRQDPVLYKEKQRMYNILIECQTGSDKKRARKYKRMGMDYITCNNALFE